MPAVSKWLEEWDDLIDSASMDAGKRYSTKFGNTYHNYRPVEASAPIVINDVIWRMRVLYKSRTKTIYLDVREYRRLDDDVLEPTMHGITLPIKGWFKLFETAFKLMKKWSGK